eukprot:TRINITY_DN8017_c0_g1_i1.p2 TRINITY_DN8017_c0_g1~~TRINITY_DN8017_c0_g1_i1.p2  ORF type:complete len:254 (+),score=61.83 TRINITY_DN8017_c0_g1_i1:2-763(+)
MESGRKQTEEETPTHTGDRYPPEGDYELQEDEIFQALKDVYENAHEIEFTLEKNLSMYLSEKEEHLTQKAEMETSSFMRVDRYANYARRVETEPIIRRSPRNEEFERSLRLSALKEETIMLPTSARYGTESKLFKSVEEDSIKEDEALIKILKDHQALSVEEEERKERLALIKAERRTKELMDMAEKERNFRGTYHSLYGKDDEERERQKIMDERAKILQEEKALQKEKRELEMLKQEQQRLIYGSDFPHNYS